MLKHIKRVSYILAALVIGLAIGLKVNKTKTVEVVKEVTVEKVVTVPATLPSTGISEPVPVVAPEPVTWQQNPNNCNEATQWIAAEAPFYCIDKPTARKTVQAPKAGVATKASTTNRVAVSGTCEQWIAQAGITDVANARELIRRESGCNPNAINKSSGACGVAQELPCGKSGCSLGDGACQVAWMHRYVMSRYKSWANAIAHHNAENWY